MTNWKKDVKAVIRLGKLADAASILEIQRNVVMEMDYLITVPEEFDKTPEQQTTWMQNVIDNERELILVAEMEGKVIGWLVFHSAKRERLAHTGSLGMMIHKDYREIGIGRMLIRELLEWAGKNPWIEKIGLGVFSSNQRAISLYKSMGFKEEGRKRKEIKLEDNVYADDILMYTFV